MTWNRIPSVLLAFPPPKPFENSIIAQGRSRADPRLQPGLTVRRLCPRRQVEVGWKTTIAQGVGSFFEFIILYNFIYIYNHV